MEITWKATTDLVSSIAGKAYDYATEPAVAAGVGYLLLQSTESMLRNTITQCTVTGALILLAPVALTFGGATLYSGVSNDKMLMVNRAARVVLGGAVIAHTVLSSHFSYNHACK